MPIEWALPLMKRRQVNLRRALTQHLECLQGAGVQQLKRPTTLPGDQPQDALAASQAPTTPPAGMDARGTMVTQDLTGSRPHLATAVRGGAHTEEGHQTAVYQADVPQIPRASSLEVLQEEVAQCGRCSEIAGSRTQTVFGVGNTDARLCILGEAPGAEEDRLGEPFVGPAGELLNKILAACRLRREEVYILNILKCRPPGNRNPTPEEACACRPFLERQLQLIRPEFICCMGRVAAQNLLATTSPVGQLRGKVHHYQDIRVVCTYHPAYLLRTPSAKGKTWEDMKLLMRAMGVDLEG